MVKVLEFQLQHPFNQYSGLISLRIDCFDLLEVQGTLKGLFSRGSSQPRNWAQVSHISGRFFNRWAIREAHKEASVRAHSLWLCQLFMTLWTIAHQTPLSMGFSRQEYWRVLPFPYPEDLSDPGIEFTSLTSPALACGFFTTNTTWEALCKEERFVKHKWNYNTPLHRKEGFRKKKKDRFLPRFS